MFSFVFDQDLLSDAYKDIEHVANGMEKAIASSTNEVLNSARRRTAAEMATTSSGRLGTFYMAFGIDPASMRGTSETVTGSLYIDDARTIPLSAFEARQTAEGVELDITGSFKMTFQGAFGPLIDRLGNNIYRRLGKKRFPIEKIADLKATEIPGITDRLQSQRDQVKYDLKKAIERRKTELMKGRFE
jgi:hypothetical protein